MSELNSKQEVTPLHPTPSFGRAITHNSPRTRGMKPQALPPTAVLAPSKISSGFQRLENLFAVRALSGKQLTRLES